MRKREKTLHVAREWLAKAEEDFVTASHTLKLGGRRPTAAVCFHAQQTVEKCLKPLLTFRGAGFPKTHDIDAPLALLPAKERPSLTPETQRELTLDAAAVRYPGTPEISLAEARRAVVIARGVRAEVRKLLSGRRPGEPRG